MNKALRVPDYLGHILKAIERIARYTSDMDELGFLNNELVQDAVIRNIEITRWTWNLSGKRFSATSPACKP